MEYIELVIKIPEASYKATCNGWMLPSDVENVVQGIKNGTPLPKGHGRLGDLSKIYVELNEAQVEGSEEYKGLGEAKQIVCDASTIIEADKEVQE